MSIKAAIKKNKNDMFRRVYIKRRVEGEYEATWQRIPQKYIVKFGKLDFSIDDIKINFLKNSGFSLTVNNKDGYFSDISDSKSIFYNAISITRTMVKVEAGYNYNGTEYPTDSTMFVGLIGEDYKYTENTNIQYEMKHISNVFDEMAADEIPGMNTSLTASEVVTKIRDFEDANSVAVFQKYITTGGWTIESTTQYYLFATNSTLQNMSCWEIIRKLAEAENMIAYVDRVGDFHFESKTANTTAAIYHLSGVGDNDKTYGHNIIGNIVVDDNIRKVYNRIMVKFAEDETTTSYKIRKQTYTWGDSSTSFIYGVRTYKYVNLFLDADRASATADILFDEYKWPKEEVQVKTKYMPHLNINDRVSLTYKTQQVEGDYLWGYFLWGEGIWGSRKGFNINKDNVDYRLTKISHRLNDFSSVLTMREI